MSVIALDGVSARLAPSPNLSSRGLTLNPGNVGIGDQGGGMRLYWNGFLLGPNGGLGHQCYLYNTATSNGSNQNTVYGYSWYNPNSTGIASSYTVRCWSETEQSWCSTGGVSASPLWQNLDGVNPNVIYVPLGHLWHIWLRYNSTTSPWSQNHFWLQAPSA